jgi:hypothetical protein
MTTAQHMEGGDIVKELLSALKQALDYIDGDAGITDPNLCVGSVRYMDLETGKTRVFDAMAARDLIRHVEAGF